VSHGSFAQLTPHAIQTELGQSSFGSVISYSVFVQAYTLALPNPLDVSVFITQGSNPTPVTAGFRLELEERVDTIHKQSAIARFAIILGHSIFINFVNLQYLIAPLKGQSYFVNDPRPFQSPFCVCVMGAFFARVLFVNARLAQAE